ncbi:hypothetical protein M8J71_11680 [Pseudarthrobacter sp. R1]|uniref:hypothetical protein n=1 Tax=Pseudarthrobacter sp. R1 TaxID=2944934 RepID=UPI00210F1C2B|nr:hypothetical protein [Pseudarthrobacter sp. R1]MCQ6271142.1 hypothetical protein [Pseudarthrobacter sp. R1]
MNLNDTSDYAFGTQSASLVTNATGSFTFFDKHTLNIDATGKVFRVWMKVDGLAKASRVEPVAASDAGVTNYFMIQAPIGTTGLSLPWKSGERV